MTELIDLTLTLGSDRVAPVPGADWRLHRTPAYPRIPRPLQHQADPGYPHGTHVDAPYHFHADGVTVDNMPLERYMGPARLLDLRQTAQSLTP